LESFPTLSSANVSVNYPRSLYEHPNVKVTFENGYEEVRSLASVGRFKELEVVYRVNSADANTIIQFLMDRKLEVEPFIYVHPLLGTDTVRYASPELPVVTMIDGPEVWYELTLVLREVY